MFSLLRIRTATVPLTRLASTQAQAAGAGVAKKVPFAAPPVDETKGALGQVYLPDMAALERQYIVEVRIPSAPDNYTSSSSDDAPFFPLLRPGAIETVAPPETHLGGGPSSTANAAK